MTTDVLGAFVVALAVAALSTPLVARLAWRIGAVDRPGGRRVHARATPRLGGLAVLGGFLAGLAVIAVIDGEASLPPNTTTLGLLGGAVLIALVGMVDDVKELGAKKKLLAQVVVTSIAWWCGARFMTLEIPGFGPVEVSPALSYVLSLIWVLAFVNAINLIDGLDGLAGGIVLFACITNTIVAFATDNVQAAIINAALGGAVFGFLFYNFNPARIFLGDTGSMMLGFTLATAALTTGRQKESTLVAFLVPLIALGVPLMDTLFTMLRRFLARRPIFSADRGHIHHRLLDLGLTHRRVVLGLYGASVVMCSVSLVAAFGKDWQVGGALVVATLVVVGGARFAGYFQLALVGRDQRIERDIERLRTCLPGALERLAECRDRENALGLLVRHVLDPVGFASAEVVVDGETRWQWARDERRSSVSYSLLSVDGANELRVVAPPDHVRPSPQIEVLLLLAVDGVFGRPEVEMAERRVRKDSHGGVFGPAVEMAERRGEDLEADRRDALWTAKSVGPG